MSQELITTLKQGQLQKPEEIRGVLLLSALRFQTNKRLNDGREGEESASCDFFEHLLEFADTLDEEINYQQQPSPSMGPVGTPELRGMEWTKALTPPGSCTRGLATLRENEAASFGANGSMPRFPNLPPQYVRRVSPTTLNCRKRVFDFKI